MTAAVDGKGLGRLVIAAMVVGAGASLAVREYRTSSTAPGVAWENIAGDVVAIDSSDSLPGAKGRLRPILAKDSAVLVALIATTCPSCRLNGRSYVALAESASVAGIATRIVVGNGYREMLQYARLTGAENLVLADSLFEYFALLNAPSVPRFLLIDVDRKVVGRWRGSLTYPELAAAAEQLDIRGAQREMY